MQSVSPVFTDAEVEYEQIIALDQPEYLPIAVMHGTRTDGSVANIVRFRLSDDERKAISEGADILLNELTSGHFTPVCLTVCMPDTKPEIV